MECSYSHGLIDKTKPKKKKENEKHRKCLTPNARVQSFSAVSVECSNDAHMRLKERECTARNQANILDSR